MTYIVCCFHVSISQDKKLLLTSQDTDAVLSVLVAKQRILSFCCLFYRLELKSPVYTLVNVYVDLVVFTHIVGTLKTGSGSYWP